MLASPKITKKRKNRADEFSLKRRKKAAPFAIDEIVSCVDETGTAQVYHICAEGFSSRIFVFAQAGGRGGRVGSVCTLKCSSTSRILLATRIRLIPLRR